MTPQWDTTLQASNFLPDPFNASAAAKLFRPVCIGYPVLGGDRRGMDPALIAAQVAPTLANTVEDRFIGRLTPGSDRFNGAFQAGQGIEEQLQDGNAFRSRRASASPTTSPARARRSFAAAGASSTTGRRATWCST